MDCAKTDEPIEMPFGLWTRVGQRKHVLHGTQIPHAKGQSLGEGHARACLTTLCCELCKNRPAHVVQWSNHLSAMCSRAWRSRWPGFDSSLSPGTSTY